ncbi:HelD family protein [Micropruina sonneratiae]|uniref:HelD family protein n=1 Tax=Micropruina sonneratiae TaxID=2986940 RepID=UPI002225DABB|nr:DNA/RNA helicase domain-containing protein [Micropruina sp. KQZ13P-5]MCW3157525.1 AAA family ATPase [Micropruina sp. KQZ13P-5]
MPASDALTEARTHLVEARAALRDMREHTASLEALAGDRLSGEFLKQTLYRRMMSLRDDPSTPLFFGRIDYRAATGADEDEDCWIGRLHVTREMGSEPMVYDWRAPVALPFYRASRTEPMGVALRRRFGFSQGAITAFEDEQLTGSGPGDDSFGHSEILEAEIERPRTGPMRDIVATIQPEQDLIVRAPLDTSVVVQGAPGTGKTAVGLHRAAYLLYAYRDQLSRSGVMVVGPNASFLSYIGDVLPALGEIDAVQETLESLVARTAGRPVAATDEAHSAVLKGDARMATVLHRAVWESIVEPAETLVVPRGSAQWRVPAHRCGAVIDELRGRGVRYSAGRDMLAQRLAHQVLLRMEASGDSPDDRVQNAVARSAPVKAFVNAHWPALDAVKLVHRLLTDADFLARNADGVLDGAEQELLLIRPGRGVRVPRSATAWEPTLADLVLVDEASDLLNRTPSLGHVIIDEAQDLSPMGLRALGRRASTGSITVLGDLAQATTAYATTSWADALGHLGKPASSITELVAGFRVPRSVIAYAARLLPSIAPSLTPPHSVRRSAGDFRIVSGAAGLVDAVGAALAREGTVGVIVADAAVADAAGALTAAGVPFAHLADERGADEFRRLEVVPATLAKGLEFDHVVLIEPAAIVAAEPDRVTGLRRLYVCLTRAVSSLAIVHGNPLPAELDAA